MTVAVFNRDEVWAELRAQPGSTARELAQSMRKHPRAIRCALERMEECGNVTRALVKGRAHWTATNKPPKDLRGRSEGARYGRSFGGKPEHIKIAVAARIAKAKAGTLKSRETHVLPRAQSMLAGKTALEMCWPSSFTTLKTQRVVNRDNATQGPKRPIGVGIAESEEAA